MLPLLQKKLEDLYSVQCPQAVEEFVLEEEWKKEFSKQVPWITHSAEILMVEQKNEELSIGLFLDPQLLEVSDAWAWETLDAEQIKQLFPLIEGVSHFVYLLWHAQQEKPLTQLELELQGEVDKFILFSEHATPEEQRAFLSQLSIKGGWIQNLSALEKERYALATLLSRKYCHAIQQWKAFPEGKDFLEEIREFYRMNQQEKIHHIENFSTLPLKN